MGGSSSATVGDYNNDGFSDLFITSVTGNYFGLYRNSGTGTLNWKKTLKRFISKENLKSYDATFFDFDNDGALDILIAGESNATDGRSVFMYHNEGNGKFTDVLHLLPESIKSGKQVCVFDYNNDGDLDILIAGINGGISLLRNDGGNMNHYIGMTLVGLRAGRAKNNYFGVGAKVEIRAGDLYQSLIVTDPQIHFGLGNRSKVETIRITWTNGVPQNIFLPGADQSLIEAQTLKGSCPFLYTWNGEEYTLSKDILWRSALGMPLGIMAEPPLMVLLMLPMII